VLAGVRPEGALCDFAKMVFTDPERLKKNRKIYFPVQDNPRRLGKSQARLIGPAPVKPGFNPAERQNSPVVRAMFAHRRMRMSNQAVRDDEKPFRTESTSSGRFRA
jgi:hypothetical protein